jgi:hypothetical protein
MPVARGRSMKHTFSVAVSRLAGYDLALLSLKSNRAVNSLQSATYRIVIETTELRRNCFDNARRSRKRTDRKIMIEQKCTQRAKGRIVVR